MNRKQLSMLLLLGAMSGSFAMAQHKVSGYIFEDANSNGVKDKKEMGLPAIGVSNGRDIVETDKNGFYSIAVEDGQVLFMIKPAGYRAPQDGNNLFKSYYLHKDSTRKGIDAERYLSKEALAGKQMVNFPLRKDAEAADFRTLVMSDPQTYTMEDMDWLARGITQELYGVKNTAFALVLGDLVGDDLSLFPAYKKEMAKIGIPFHNVIGNHDMDKQATKDEHADETFEHEFGPANYAFNYGQAHFIVLDNILYPNAFKPAMGGNYTGGFRPDQLAFIKNDLARVPKDKLVVVSYHIPMDDVRYFRKEDRDQLFGYLKDFPNVLLMCGHTHIQRQIEFGKAEGWQGAKPLHEYNAATASGDWYSGIVQADGTPLAMMNDGTPKGYAFLNIKGNTYTIDYKAAGKPADYQMRIFTPQVIGQRQSGRTPFYANFFMGREGDKVSYRIDGGEWKAMQFVNQEDPFYQSQYQFWDLTNKLVAGRRPSYPAKSTHLWQGQINNNLPLGEHTVEVRTTDRYGKVSVSSTTLRMEPSVKAQ